MIILQEEISLNQLRLYDYSGERFVEPRKAKPYAASGISSCGLWIMQRASLHAASLRFSLLAPGGEWRAQPTARLARITGAAQR